jgi:IS4 transposase
LYDIRTSIPCFIHITDGATHDVHGLDVLTYDASGFYILDRGYLDFQRLYDIHQQKAFFVTRAKDSFKYTRLNAGVPDKTAGVTCDQCVKPKGFYTSKHYPAGIRREWFTNIETGRRMVFLTNNFDLQAVDIALLYKYRWKVELFLKWIKQHLMLKSFWGTFPNAVSRRFIEQS